MLKIEGELEIDRERGVIYFHSKHGYTVLRICQLSTPIPTPSFTTMLDITHMYATNWKSK